jgi:hypothetical protein
MIKQLKWVTRVAGLGALVLGILIWRGMLVNSLRAHMALGGIVAVVLAILAIFALAMRVRIPVAIVSLLWAAATVYVGIAQVGGGGRVLLVIHPILGIGAIGLAEMLSGAIARARPSLV